MKLELISGGLINRFIIPIPMPGSDKGLKIMSIIFSMLLYVITPMVLAFGTTRLLETILPMSKDMFFWFVFGVSLLFFGIIVVGAHFIFNLPVWVPKTDIFLTDRKAVLRLAGQVMAIGILLLVVVQMMV